MVKWIVATEMIAEISESCTVVFTGDKAFLYSMIKRIVNVAHVFIR